MVSPTLYYRALLAAVVCLLAPIIVAQENSECTKGQVDVVVVVDISSESADIFQKQQDRLVSVIGQLDPFTSNAKLAVVSYNSQAKVISPFTSPDAGHIAQVLTTIKTLRSTATATSTVPALEAAIKELKTNGRGGAKIVILAHGGKSSSTLEQVLEVDEKLKETGASVFVVTADSQPDLTVLVGYAGDRARVYAAEEDKNAFIEQLRKATDVTFCIDTPPKPDNFRAATETAIHPNAASSTKKTSSAAVKSRVGGKATSPEPNASKQASKESTTEKPKETCEFSKVDLMIVMDTSGSVADAFKSERAFAENLIKALPSGSFDSGDLQVGVVSFSAISRIVLPFELGRSQKQTLRAIENVEHTGGPTRISQAVRRAIEELNRARRADAKQVFVMISDGHGQDFWSTAVKAGKDLQAANAEIFSVTVTNNFNLRELILFAGTEDRIFIGAKKDSFIPEASRHIRQCLNPSPKVTKSSKIVTELLSDACPDTVDLLFIIDSSGSVTEAFLQERKFATDVIEAAPAGDFDGRIAVAAVRFSKTADLVFPLGEVKGQAQLIERINNINHTGGATSAASGVAAAVREINAHHRKSARLVVVLITDGNSQDEWSAAQSAAKQLHDTGAEVSVVTLSHEYYLLELELYASSKDQVYIDEHSKDFINAAKSSISSGNCASGAAVAPVAASPAAAAPVAQNTPPPFAIDEEAYAFVDKTTNAPKALPQTEAKVTTAPAARPAASKSGCENDLVDLLLLIDTSGSVADAFLNERKFAEDIVKVTPAGDFTNRISVATVRFDKTATLEFGFDSGRDQETVLKDIQSINFTGGETSLAAGFNTAMQEIAKGRRQNARLVIVLVSDGNSQDDWAVVEATAKKVHDIGAEVYAVTYSKQYSRPELELYTGNPFFLYVDERIPLFLDAAGQSVRQCPGESKVTKQPTTLPVVDAKPTEAPKDTRPPVTAHSPAATSAAQSTRATTQRPTQPPTQPTTKPPKAQPSANPPTQPPAKPSTQPPKPPTTLPQVEAKVTTVKVAAPPATKSACQSDLVDLLLVIDTSGSVADAFLNERKFAEDLVKVIPSGDFANRISVATVRFDKTATLEFGFDSKRDQDAVLKDIQSINFTGGETSLAAGFNTGMQEIAKGRRQNARLVIVLVSDGNSQDDWAVVESTAKKVHDIGAEVYAVTYSKQYSRPELELYTGNPFFLYVDERIPLFIDAAKQSVAGGGSCPTAAPPASATTAIDFVKDTNKLPIDEPAAASGSSSCPGDLVDVLFVLDTSGSVAEEFKQEKQFAVDLIKAVPAGDFDSRISVSLVKFHGDASLEFGFGEVKTQQDVLSRIDKIEHQGGATSAVSGFKLGLQQIAKGHREGARLVIVLISDGNSQDEWKLAQQTAAEVRGSGAEVYAVTLSPDYYLQELELYAGNPNFVYIDDRIKLFIDAAKESVVSCPGQTHTAPTAAPSSTTSAPPPNPYCTTDKVDLLFVIDVSGSVAQDFPNERKFAEDLISSVAEDDYKGRINVAAIKFTKIANLAFPFNINRTRTQVLNEIKSIDFHGGTTSAVAGFTRGLEEIAKNRRKDARLVIVLISDGNSQDKWDLTQATAKRVHDTGAEVYSVTLSKNYYFEELKEYSGNPYYVYVGERIRDFIAAAGKSVARCDAGGGPAPAAHETSGTSTVASREPPAFAIVKQDVTAFVSQDDVKAVSKASSGCAFSKMDLMIILDASTSRNDVFEHQRELALSLIERLPIAADQPQVAVGITSFTQLPTLQLNLGLGRDKQAIRKAIDNIVYHGGSTLTASAVKLAVDDLNKNKRTDAVQVVVLMNDGISQNMWEDVQASAEALENSGAQRFGVALGDKVDMHELKLYIGDEKRIFRDGQTEQFLSEVVALLNGGGECPTGKTSTITKDTTKATQKATAVTALAVDACSAPNVDVVVLLDTSDQANEAGAKSLFDFNRELLLDVLGAFMLQPESDRVKVSVISFAQKPKLEVSFKDSQERETIFTKVQAIKLLGGEAEYANAVDFAINEYEKTKRPNARPLFLIVGDGQTKDSQSQTQQTANKLKQIQGLSCHAVHSGKEMAAERLTAYTGAKERVYNYDRNGEFATAVKKITEKPSEEECRGVTRAPVTLKSVDEPTYSAKPKAQDLPDDNDAIKDNEGIKVVAKTTVKITQKPTTRVTTTRPPTTRVTTTRPPTTRKATTRSTLRTTRRTTTPRTTTRTPRTRPTKATTTTPEATDTPEATTSIFPGCLLDVMLILDSSGSVEATYLREKDLAAGIVQRLRVSPHNARVAMIKYAGIAQSVFSFDKYSNTKSVLRALHEARFTGGITVTADALQLALSEYTQENGARPGEATPLVIVFTDGFAHQDTTGAANLLRRIIPNVYAVAINHQYPINRPELEQIAGSPDRVFTDANIQQFHAVIDKLTNDCQ